MVADLPQLHEDVAQPLAGGAADALQRDNHNNNNMTGLEKETQRSCTPAVLCVVFSFSLPSYSASDGPEAERRGKAKPLYKNQHKTPAS